MPPLPERPGTVQADIYALGMVFYVISTGRDPAFFPETFDQPSRTNKRGGFHSLEPHHP